jgi:hypothetical protein
MMRDVILAAIGMLLVVLFLVSLWMLSGAS